MVRIERFQNASELETLIHEAHAQGLRVRLGSQDWTVEILDKTSGDFLDKFRSADALATVFKSELASLHNKLAELRAKEVGSLSGTSGTPRDIKKVPRSNDPTHRDQLDREVEAHRTLVGVLPTVARITRHLGAPLLSHKLHHLGQVLNDEKLPLAQRNAYALGALQTELSTLNALAGDEDTPGHFQLDNFCRYVELTQLERKKAAILVLPQLKSQTAAILNHPNDPFALKRFIYKALPIIAAEVGKTPGNHPLATKLQAAVGKLLKHDSTSLDFETNRQTLLALQSEVNQALKKSPLRDTANAVFETIGQATPDRLETLLAEDLGTIAQALRHQGENSLASGFFQLAAALESTSNISHLSLHKAVVELRFLTQQCLERVDSFTRQPGDQDDWGYLRDKNNVRQFAYAFLSSVEPWEVSPQELEYVKTRVTEYEASRPFAPGQPAPNQNAESPSAQSSSAQSSSAQSASAQSSSTQSSSAQSSSPQSASVRQLSAQPEQPTVATQDKPWYELDPEEIFGRPENATATTGPSLTPETIESDTDQSQESESSQNPAASINTRSSLAERSTPASTGEQNPTPHLLVKAFATEIQTKIDRHKFLEKVAQRDEQLALDRHERLAKVPDVEEQAQPDVNQTFDAENALSEGTGLEGTRQASIQGSPSLPPAAQIDLNVLASLTQQMQRDPTLARHEAHETLESIANEIKSSRERQLSTPLQAKEETEYRIALQSYQIELSGLTNQGELRKAVEHTIATFAQTTDATLAEVLQKVAPLVTPDQYKQALRQYAKDAAKTASFIERRVALGYAETAEQEAEQARLKAAQRKTQFYAQGLAQAEQMWPVDKLDARKFAAIEVIADAERLARTIDGQEPGEAVAPATLQDELTLSIGNLTDLIWADIQTRSDASGQAESVLSDDQLKATLRTLAVLQYAGGLTTAEREAERFAVQRAQGQRTELSPASTAVDVQSLLALRASEVQAALDANLAIARAAQAEPDTKPADSDTFEDLGTNHEPALSSAQRHWAQVALSELLGFLASRLQAIRLALSINRL